tara:strand:- start:128 stop:586 length:459 start_codon:yes stop_codon:yes gene_type:complete
MLKKIFFIILLITLLNNCDYKPVYSNQNKGNFKIIVMDFSGDKEINNIIATNLSRNSRDNSDKIINISFDTKYKKNVLAKNTTGAITDYQSVINSSFIIQKENSSKNVLISEKFNFQKMTDKYEEKNYEQNIKRNLANSIAEKLILRLAIIE